MHSLFESLGLGPVPGERLTRPDYGRDYGERASAISDGESWKLERRQDFQEHDLPSWDAARRGDWNEALRLLEEMRERLQNSQREAAARRYVFHRVRVVEEPFTTYVRWELHGLKLQAECGYPIRVVDAGRLKPLETSGLVPELVVLGDTTLYEVLYTDEGFANGAVRFTDPNVVTRCQDFIKGLYEEGEDMSSFFHRKIAQ